MSDKAEMEDKSLYVGESDPLTIAERQNDPPGSFLDTYRSLSIQHVETDKGLVDKSVVEHVVPQCIRYAIMKKGGMEVYRGIVKAVDGGVFYFNWSPENAFKLVPVVEHRKQIEAENLFQSCRLGCDLRKSETPIDPEETVEEATTEKERKKKKAGPPAVPAEKESRFQVESASKITDVHPGSTQAAMPDDNTTGRNWHGEPIARSQESKDEKRYWTALDLLKSVGQKLKETAPRMGHSVTPLESRYMQEVMGLSTEEIQKGVHVPPRFHVDFEKWKANNLNKSMSSLKSWLDKHNV